MKQTAIQKTIERFKQLQENTGSSKADELQILYSMLDYENDTIQRAYVGGFGDATALVLRKELEHKSASDYYNKTYKGI